MFFVAHMALNYHVIQWCSKSFIGDPGLAEQLSQQYYRINIRCGWDDIQIRSYQFCWIILHNRHNVEKVIWSKLISYIIILWSSYYIYVMFWNHIIMYWYCEMIPQEWASTAQGMFALPLQADWQIIATHFNCGHEARSVVSGIRW